jgi:hypothetical protein
MCPNHTQSMHAQGAYGGHARDLQMDLQAAFFRKGFLARDWSHCSFRYAVLRLGSSCVPSSDQVVPLRFIWLATTCLHADSTGFIAGSVGGLTGIGVIPWV